MFTDAAPLAGAAEEPPVMMPMQNWGANPGGSANLPYVQEGECQTLPCIIGFRSLDIYFYCDSS